MSKPSATVKYLRIGQLAGRCGVTARALRLYERRGLLQPDAHPESGYRLYGAPAPARLNEISVLKRAGFSLAEIGALLERRGSAAALVEARIVALRQEVRSKSHALEALKNTWHGLASTSQTIDQLGSVDAMPSEPRCFRSGCQMRRAPQRHGGSMVQARAEV